MILQELLDEMANHITARESASTDKIAGWRTWLMSYIASIDADIETVHRQLDALWCMPIRVEHATEPAFHAVVHVVPLAFMGIDNAFIPVNIRLSSLWKIRIVVEA